MSRRTVFFIGGGNMATAIVAGLDLTKWRVVVCEVVPEARQRLEDKFGVETATSVLDPKLADSDVIVFAIKPQSVPEVLQQMQPVDVSGRVIISIMAGIPLSVLQAGLRGSEIKFVRTMPNTPLMVGKGVTGVYTTDNSAKQDLLGPTSVIIFINEEDDLNKVTAISGSGPAYFFAFMEALRAAGVAMGLSKEDAGAMAIGTCLGAATLASQSSDDLSTLRENVTSKGGTTEQALLVFKDRNLHGIVDEAAAAALNRGREMAKQFAPAPKL